MVGANDEATARPHRRLHRRTRCSPGVRHDQVDVVRAARHLEGLDPAAVEAELQAHLGRHVREPHDDLLEALLQIHRDHPIEAHLRRDREERHIERDPAVAGRTGPVLGSADALLHTHAVLTGFGLGAVTAGRATDRVDAADGRPTDRHAIVPRRTGAGVKRRAVASTAKGAGAETEAHAGSGTDIAAVADIAAIDDVIATGRRR